MATVYFKDPDSITDVTVDWSGLLGSRTISTSAWVIGAGLATSNETNTTTTTGIRFIGGSDGVTYEATNTITLPGGTTYQRTLFVRVRDVLVDEGRRAPVVDLAEAKHYLRVTTDDEDQRIESLIRAATEFVEGSTGRTFLSKSKTMTLSKFEDKIFIPSYPTQAVARVQYYDSNNTLTTLASSKWLSYVENGATVLTIAPDQTWPDVYDRPDAVRLLWFAGYDSAADVPSIASQAILMLAREWYDNPGLSSKEPIWLKPMLWALRTGHVADA
ncbi:MAG: hypothetical protein CMN21_24895 [Rubinisphaera sp.]|uniref:head-tail connector protein n=1 Tax=Rubinisphaera sp. TaxID=2024857 RepID=UPI000C0CECE0|nr:head-tail connector protein [Rubinisphaera sp.]MBV12443.1 hypothetical protein [Rubinisphaera sp.]